MIPLGPIVEACRMITVASSVYPIHINTEYWILIHCTTT